VQIREYRPDDRDAIMALAPRLTEGKPLWRDDAANHGSRAFYAALGYLEEDVRLTKKIRTGTG
jgi:hypothetical protein